MHRQGDAIDLSRLNELDFATAGLLTIDASDCP